MAPKFDKFTVKAREAVQAAQSLADQHDHQAIEPAHLLLALLNQEEGVVPALATKISGGVAALRDAVRRELDQRPRLRVVQPEC